MTIHKSSKMGNTQFITLKQVAEYQESKTYHGKGLFAKCDISAGTILRGDDNVHRGLMNDADFVYPKELTQDYMKESFKKYMEIGDKSACNTRDFDVENEGVKLDFSHVLKDIKKGDELTRMYGIDRWIAYLFHDIKDRNPTHNNKLKLTEEEQNKKIKAMIDAMKELGHNIEAKPK